MKQRAIFLDRDGVINKEKNYVYKIQDFEFIEGVFEVCRYLLKLNYKIIIITNQSGISRSYFSAKDFEILNKWMIKQFNSNQIEILDVFHCPHGPNDKCKCRKPKPGMLLEAQKKYAINMQKSWLIGDKEEDIIAANNSGIRNTIIVRSGHKIDSLNSKAKYILDSIYESKNVIID
jgi:D-glycero-D-manno-heptose 1,7-bisphosphate phosphatase